jgi:hypothetical protein
MAREEQPREDLLAEATGLVERVSLQLHAGIAGETDTVVGFRRDGSLAIFIGQQRVYQFTSAGALRRAYIDGLLYKAQAGRLVAMRRERTPEAVNLVSSPLDVNATKEFLAQMRGHLDALQRALQSNEYAVLGQVPAEANILERVEAWLANHAGTIAIAASPRSA